MSEARNFALRGIAVNHAFAGGTNEGGFGLSHGGEGLSAITSGDRFLDLAHGVTNARTPRLVDDGAARDLTRGLLGGFRIGHN